MRILLIEDDRKIARFVARGLEADGHVVETVHEGKRALARFAESSSDLVLLDLMLPDADGLDLLKQFRLQDATTPIFIVSARDSVEDRVRGLDFGADDYISKPFSFVELQARLRAFFRRDASGKGTRTLRVGDLEIDRVKRCVVRQGHSEPLTAREFQLLDCLMSHAQQPLTRAMLADRVWGYQFDTGTNVVDVYVNYLRKKLASLGTSPIRTLRGIGYVFDADASGGEDA